MCDLHQDDPCWIRQPGEGETKVPRPLQVQGPMCKAFRFETQLPGEDLSRAVFGLVSMHSAGSSCPVSP